MKIEGFILKESWDIQEEGILYEYIHEKTGAKLLYLATNEKNKLFSVTFKTTPEDDTGVFHILEHSVLCGSKKYPVKEPFVELLKSSMNTFLNAMTFPDKTLFPVSSCNEKDFLNLTSVYLDAVFAPAIYEQPNIFYQEGWHYDYDETNGDISYKGVVLNEMKGVESSVDALMTNELLSMLYPDTCYGHNFGGDSKKIRDLTYEQFIETHKKYYHPSNAIFYLEGDMDITKPISMIEEYMHSDGIVDTIEIKSQNTQVLKDSKKYYPISQNESEEDMTRISYGRIFCDYQEKEKILAANIICGYLADSNDAPLKRIILENELAQDVYIQVEDGIKQPMLQFHFINTKEEKLIKIQQAIESLYKDIQTNGIDTNALEATLNNIEFIHRDIGEPRALNHNMLILNSYLYGGDPTLYLKYNETFKNLREKISTDYYKELALDMLNLNKMIKVILQPSSTLGKENELEEQQHLLSIKSSWSEQEEKDIIELNKQLYQWQSSADSIEKRNTIPKLQLSDIEQYPQKIQTIIESYHKATILKHPSHIEGISYMNMYFAIPNQYQDILPELMLVSSMLGKLPTLNKGLFELTQDIKMNLGCIDFDMNTFSKKGDINLCQTYFILNCSLLTHKFNDAYRIIKEILFETDFHNEEAIEQLLIQFQNYYRENIIANGQKFAMLRACANLSSINAAKEAYEGVTCYETLKDIIEDFDNQKYRIIEAAKVLQNEVLTQHNLVCSITTKEHKDYLYPIIDIFKKGQEVNTNMCFIQNKINNQFIKIPTAVSYAVAANNVKTIGAHINGAWEIASQIVTLEYLWNEVRVKGGAYGSGMLVDALGNVVMYSYRDPGSYKSYDIYKKIGQFLKNAAHHIDLNGFIISRIAKKEPLLSSREMGVSADLAYLREETYEEMCQLWKEMLNVTPEDIECCGNIFNQMWEDMNYCLVASDHGEYNVEQEIAI